MGKKTGVRQHKNNGTEPLELSKKEETGGPGHERRTIRSRDKEV